MPDATPYQLFTRSTSSVIGDDLETSQVDNLVVLHVKFADHYQSTHGRCSFPSERALTFALTMHFHSHFEEEFDKLPSVPGRTKTEILAWFVSSVHALLEELDVISVSLEGSIGDTRTCIDATTSNPRSTTGSLPRSSPSIDEQPEQASPGLISRRINSSITGSSRQRRLTCNGSTALDRSEPLQITVSSDDSKLGRANDLDEPLTKTSRKRKASGRADATSAEDVDSYTTKRSESVAASTTTLGAHRRAALGAPVPGKKRPNTKACKQSDATLGRMSSKTDERTQEELKRLERVIGRRSPPSERIIQILDKARTLSYLPLLGRPHVMNDGNIGQYWIIKPLENFQEYIGLGLRNGYRGKGNACFNFFYDVPTALHRYDRFISYLKISGLSNPDAAELEGYLRKVTTEQKFNELQAKAFAQRCGFDHILQEFFEICNEEKVEVICLLCDPDSGLGRLDYDRCNGNKSHFRNMHDITTGNAIGRCHFPGCPVVWPEVNDEDVLDARDEHLRNCPCRTKLFPVEVDD